MGASEHFIRLKLDLSSTKICFLPDIEFLVSRPVFIDKTVHFLSFDALDGFYSTRMYHLIE